MNMWEMLALVTGYSFLRNLVREQRKTNELLMNDREKMGHLNQRIAQQEEKNHALRLPCLTPDYPLEHPFGHERKIRNTVSVNDIEKSMKVLDAILKPIELAFHILICFFLFFFILFGAAFILGSIGFLLFLFLPGWAVGIILFPIGLIYVIAVCAKCNKEEDAIESMFDAIEFTLNMMAGIKVVGCMLLGLFLLVMVGLLIFFLIKLLFV